MSISINSAIAHTAGLARPHADDHPDQPGRNGLDTINVLVAHTAELSRPRVDDHPQQRAPTIPDPIGPVSARVAAVAIGAPMLTAADIHAHLGELVALNPQPLPPVDGGRRADLVALNPQPLPPVDGGHLAASDLNPQPLPPRWLDETVRAHLFDAVALNPQPLPPKESALLRMDDFCGNGGHRPVPPLPGPRGGGAI